MASKQKAASEDSEPYFLDTNILMYAIGSRHALRDACRGALGRAVDRQATLVTDSEVLQEILYRYFSIRKPDIAQVVYHAAVDLCAEIFPVRESDTARALQLLLKRPDLSTRDAIHIATMEAGEIRRILSTDRDFDGLEGIERIDPAHFLE